MFSKNLDNITVDHFATLIEGGARESSTVDFKRELPSSGEEDTPKFCFLVSALANTGGGRVYYGVDEAGGVATTLASLGDIDPDAQERRLTQVLQSNIEPVVPGVRFHWIDSEQHGRFMVLDVPRSWAGPHMVKLKKGYRMYSRVGPQNVPLDVVRMRQAFSAAEEVPERIRRWRRERLSAILEADTPAPIKSAPAIIVHLVPYASFEDEYRLTATQVASREMHNAFTPITAGNFSHRINMDGVVRFASTAGAYCQLYRSGRVESVLSDMWTNQNQQIIKEYEYYVLEAVTRQLAGLTKLDVPGPFAFLLTLANVRGYTTAEIWPGDPVPNAIDRDHLLVPDVLINGLSPSLPSQLKHAFDIVWNACDRPGSTNFDANDNWTGHKIPGLPEP